MLLDLTPDELLSTTRAVRHRLDYSRPVEREVILECAALAQQAPNASNAQKWHFVFVTEPAKKLAIARLYKRGAFTYMNPGSPPPAADDAVLDQPTGNPLADHMHEMPVLLVPCIEGRTDGPSANAVEQSAQWGTIAPATWSFMLAARARGLGTCWTSLHLLFEREAAEVLGIPYDKVQQIALTPVAYTKGTDFKQGKRESIDSMVSWDTY